MRVHLVQALWVYLLLTLARLPEIVAQSGGGSLNFCDIPCVQNVYRFYCGEAKCTTGASDYGQIFTLCTERCAAAVAGEAMTQCLTTTEPDRNDWDQVQESVLQEIVSFCTGYEIAVDPDITPLSLKKTDKQFLNTLFDEPEEPEAESKAKKGKGRKSKKKKNKKGKKDKANDEEEEPKKEKKTDGGDPEKEKELEVEPKKGKRKEKGTDRKDSKKKTSTKTTPRAPSGSTKKRGRQPNKQTKKEDKEDSSSRPDKEQPEEISLPVKENEDEEAMASVGELDKDVDMEESFDSEFDKSVSSK